jgi:hypothetical protein
VKLVAVIGDVNNTSNLDINRIQRACNNHQTKARSRCFLDELVIEMQQLKLEKKMSKKKKNKNS